MPGEAGGDRAHHGGPGGSSITLCCFAGRTGCLFPVFPRGRDYRDRRPPRLLPLILQIYQHLDNLCEAVDFHQRMLNYSRRDLLALEEVVKEMVELSGSDLRDPDLGRQRDGDH